MSRYYQQYINNCSRSAVFLDSINRRQELIKNLRLNFMCKRESFLIGWHLSCSASPLRHPWRIKDASCQSVGLTTPFYHLSVSFDSNFSAFLLCVLKLGLNIMYCFISLPPPSCKTWLSVRLSFLVLNFHYLLRNHDKSWAKSYDGVAEDSDKPISLSLSNMGTSL